MSVEVVIRWNHTLFGFTLAELYHPQTYGSIRFTGFETVAHPLKLALKIQQIKYAFNYSRISLTISRFVTHQKGIVWCCMRRGAVRKSRTSPKCLIPRTDAMDKFGFLTDSQPTRRETKFGRLTKHGN